MIGTDLDFAKTCLLAGKTVAIPTETVYGLAANGLNVNAVAEIFRIKKRPTFDPLILHTDSLAKVENWVVEIPKPLLLLAEHFWAGALTLLLPKKGIVPALVTSGLETVAMRIPNHPLTLELLSRLNFPLAAPSANPFGYLSPTTPLHVAQQLGNEVGYILDGGKSQIGIESTIVGIENGLVTVFRKGGIPIEDIESLLGQRVALRPHSTSRPAAPGMLQSHYAPRKPIVVGEDLSSLLEAQAGKKVGVLAFQKLPALTAAQSPTKARLVLSKSGNLSEAAQNFFDFLHQLDSLDIDVIIAEWLPEIGLGKAINDRLRRASFLEKS
ncbi:L-threonylcarbamoyladenylate synthase [Hugenholtzia roseola]|uniref:L-threonylcarbamoyladenylate synthase n=1 Tax=Hugenholtzia roseola TaxID=1002 RepID=UPI0004239D4F|nr:L-threonylcarbamoyladenylate synthase [Hugenholtzia roseola]